MALIESRQGARRLLRGTGPTITLFTYVDGVLTDATGTPTLTVTDATGATVVASTNATHAATGTYSYGLTVAAAAQTAALTATWTATVGGVAAQTFTTTHEVVGGHLFDIAQAKTFDNAAMAAVVQANLELMRDQIAEDFERILESSAVPRYDRQTLDGNGAATLVLRRPRILTVRSVTVDGTPFTAGDLTDLKHYDTGRITRHANGFFTFGDANVTVEYEHGYPAAPYQLGQAALKVARRYTISSNIYDGASVVTTEGATFTYGAAGKPGQWYGMPDVDATLQRWTDRLPGFA